MADEPDCSILGSAHIHGRAAPLGRKAVAVLSLLASRRRPVPRAELAALLWPDHDDKHARTNLRGTLHSLHRAVPALVDAGRQDVALQPDGFARVDLSRFDLAADKGLARARVSGMEAHPALVDAAAAYGGELLPGYGAAETSDLFEEWLLIERSRLQVRIVQVLQALVDVELEFGPTRGTLTIAERLAGLDELGEGAQERLLRTLWALGDRPEALRRHRDWERKLAREYGMQPTEEMRQLVAQIRQGSSDPDHGWHEGRLPVRRLMVGRDEELTDLVKQFQDGDRLVTLTGAAGVGKTTLAVEVAHHFRAETPWLVLYVDLTSVQTREGIVEALLGATGIRQIADLGEAALHGRIGGRQLLLVLDNFEHLLAETTLISGLHDACRGLSLLVTSRSPLRLHHEQVHELAPLEVPSDDLRIPADVIGCSAVRLFMARADRCGASIAPTPENLVVVSEICGRTDGLPLAIELTAARLPLLGLVGVRDALAASGAASRVFAHGPADAARGHSVREAVEWSLAQLSEPERSLFRRLSVFPGSFDIAAVRAVCAGDAALGEDDAQLLVWMARLVDFHLVATADHGSGPPRLWLLETMRSIAAELLAEAGESQLLAGQHAAYFLRHAQEQVTGPDDGDPQTGIARDHANLSAALEWFHRAQHREEDLRMLATLGRSGGLTAPTPTCSTRARSETC